MFSRFLTPRQDLTRTEDPFSHMQREIGRVVEDMFRGAPGFRTALAGGFAPNLEVKETAEGLQLTAELPGMEEKDIELSLDGDVLTLRGEKKEEKTSEERGVHMQERSYGSFQRSLRLPFMPEAGKVSACFDKGVLQVTLPKPAQASSGSNRISIQAGSPQGGTTPTGTSTVEGSSGQGSKEQAGAEI